MQNSENLTLLKTTETKSSNKSDGGSEADVLTTPTEPESTYSSNIREESNDEIVDNSTAFASSSDGRHSVTSLPQKSLIAVKSNTSFEDNSIQRVPGQSGKRKRIICTVCLPNPEIVKRARYRGRLPPICQPEGIESQSVPLMKMINSQRQQLANKIGSLIIHVNNDAKCLTSSAFSWLSWVIAAKMAHEFDCNKSFEPYSASNFDLQYVICAETFTDYSVS